MNNPVPTPQKGNGFKKKNAITWVKKPVKTRGVWLSFKQNMTLCKDIKVGFSHVHRKANQRDDHYESYS